MDDPVDGDASEVPRARAVILQGLARERIASSGWSATATESFGEVTVEYDIEALRHFEEFE